MQKWRQWENADQDAWQLALEREAVIRPLAEQGRLSPTLVQDATRQLRLSRSVLYDLLRRYKQRPQTSSLLPWKRGRATKATFLESTREELLNSSIQDFYLRPERPSVAALLQEVRRRFSEQNLPAPHYRTARKRIEALDLRLAMQKREGVKKAREKLGPVSISTLMPKSPMDVLQIDHTLVDVIVVELRRRYASALLHYKRNHWTSPFRLWGSPGFKCLERLEFRDLSATKQLSSPYFGI